MSAASDWPERLEGETILEAGSGAGRFTEVLATTGATVLSFDLSSAVEANQASNGAKDNVLIFQARIEAAPVAPVSMDKASASASSSTRPIPRRLPRVRQICPSRRRARDRLLSQDAARHAAGNMSSAG